MMDSKISSQIQIDVEGLHSESDELGSFGHASTPKVRPWTRLMIWPISLYQRVAAGRPSPCRFTPSCSAYAVESLQTHGLLKGLALATWRILRCNPWGGQGFDPVPLPRSRHRSGSNAAANHGSVVDHAAVDHAVAVNRGCTLHSDINRDTHPDTHPKAY